MRTNQVKKYEVGNLCLSTEEMCGAIETYNARTSTTRTPVIFSKDVVAMYPNLQHEGVARTFRVEFLWSDLTIEKVEEVLELGEKTTSKFLTMEQLPTREQEKLLLAMALEEGILATLKHHYYSFYQGEVRLEQEGGPVASRSPVMWERWPAMLAWVREYKARMVEATSTLPDMKQFIHQLYVDENNSVMEELPPGTRLVERSSRWWGSWWRRTGRCWEIGGLAKELANTICPYLQMEVDYPSTTPRAGCPSLTWRCRWPGTRLINFRWYRKPMANCYSILNRSAMPADTKRITLVQRGVTMLRNTRRELHHQLFIPLMEQLGVAMMGSGYPEDFRREVIVSSSLLPALEMKVKVQEGVVVAFRRKVVTRDLGPASPALRVTAPCASLGKARVACTTTVAAPSTGGSASTAGS